MNRRKLVIPASKNEIRERSAFTKGFFGNEHGMNPYSLLPDEIERFDATMGDDPFMKAIYQDAAAHWRRHLRPRHKTAEACRWQFLQMISVRYGMTFPPGIRMEELPALARYLSMRVERCVTEMDGAEDRSRKKVP